MPDFTPVHQTPAWQALQGLSQAGLPSLRELLSDPDRNASLHAQACGIRMDFSHQRVNAKVMQALQTLAKATHVEIVTLAIGEKDATFTTLTQAGPYK